MTDQTSPSPLGDVWGYAEIAAHLGVGGSTIRAYQARGQMPPPDGRVGRTPYWAAARIRAWAVERPQQRANIAAGQAGTDRVQIGYRSTP